jgi:hypothetical protein
MGKNFERSSKQNAFQKQQHFIDKATINKTSIRNFC